MSLSPVFSMHELAAAFNLLLPEKDARKTAERWFATIASTDEIDTTGNFLAEEADWRQPFDSPANVVAVGVAEQRSPTTGGYEKLRDQSVQDRADFLLRLSSFHLRLVMLVSDEAFDRIAAFLAYDTERAERARAQMELIVQVMGIPVSLT